jgi:hypothetical protein
MGGYWLTGLWTRAVTRYYLLSLPAVLIAIFIGRAINRRMQGPRFLVYIHMGLTAIGAILLAQAWRGAHQ